MIDHGRLVAAAVDGDDRALAELLADLMPLVTRFCKARTAGLPPSAGTFDDVVQEVAMAVLRALPSYRPEGGVPFVGFVHGIAKNKIADAYRGVARHPVRPTDELPERPDPAAGPEALVLRGELSAELRRLLDQLPERHRDILLMRIVERMPAGEVGAVLGTTAGAVRVAQHRALTALRALAARQVPRPGGDVPRRQQR